MKNTFQLRTDRTSQPRPARAGLRRVLTFAFVTAAVGCCGWWVVANTSASPKSMLPWKAAPLRSTLTYRCAWTGADADQHGATDHVELFPTLVDRALADAGVVDHRLEHARSELAKNLQVRTSEDRNVQTMELTCAMLPTLTRQQLADVLN
ncbi:MAG TPA: hypothetical protein VG713_10690, partial [Pirellulales bacterium]|nr:hypothetical protein [Pirellulales bacterium]